MTALESYNAHMEGDEEHDPIERLRFFLSLALTGQDWLDVEQFIDGVSQQLSDSQKQVTLLREKENVYTDKLNEQLREIKSLRQQLATVTAERDEFAGHAKDGTVIAAQLQTKLADSQKREMMLRYALENAKDALWNYGVTKHAENAEKALAATANLSGVTLCDAEPAITSGKYPLYRAWETK